MKRLLLLLGCSCALMGGAELSGVRSVYVLPMARGLDQYLVNHLTAGHVFQIVTDPKLADAVLTDHVGESLQAKLEEIAPPPAPPKPEPKTDKDKKDDASFLGDTVNKLSAPQSTFSRGRGTVFLVDAKSRQVVWSAYELPKGSGSRQLDRTASDIVSRLQHDLKKK